VLVDGAQETFGTPSPTPQPASTAETVFPDINILVPLPTPTENLFPFGSNFGDLHIEDVDDRAVSISIPRGIPFLTRYYTKLYVSQH